MEIIVKSKYNRQIWCEVWITKLTILTECCGSLKWNVTAVVRGLLLEMQQMSLPVSTESSLKVNDKAVLLRY
jgi:hypothetical protein